jgi:hypothetical protein
MRQTVRLYSRCLHSTTNRTLSMNVELPQMRQLHVKYCQLRHSVHCPEHFYEPVDSESVDVTVGLLHRAAETQFSQLSDSTQLFNSFVGDTAVV